MFDGRPEVGSIFESTAYRRRQQAMMPSSRKIYAALQLNRYIYIYNNIQTRTDIIIIHYVVYVMHAKRVCAYLQRTRN